MDTLWERIQSILDERGWSARRLAREAHLESETHVGLLRTTKDPQTSTLAKIAAAADVELAWLADGTSPRRRAVTKAVERPPVGAAALEIVLFSWTWSETTSPEDVDAIEHTVRAEAPEHPTRSASAWRHRIRQIELSIGTERALDDPPPDEPGSSPKGPAAPEPSRRRDGTGKRV